MSTPRLVFRCSPAQAQRARKRAEQEGVKLSKVLRALLIDWLEGRQPSIPMLRAIEELRAELRAIGVNLNQMARVLNSGERPSLIAPKVEEVAALVEAVQDQLEPYHVPRKP